MLEHNKKALEETGIALAISDLMTEDTEHRKKSFAKAQRRNQVAGNTSKRLPIQIEDSRPTKRTRREVTGEGEPDQGTHTTVPTDGPKPVVTGPEERGPKTLQARQLELYSQREEEVTYEGHEGTDIC